MIQSCVSELRERHRICAIHLTVYAKDGSFVSWEEDAALEFLFVDFELDVVSPGSEAIEYKTIFPVGFLASVTSVTFTHLSLLPILLDDIVEFGPLVSLFDYLRCPNVEVNLA